VTTDADSPGLPEGLLTTIDHVGIAVPDLREAIAFYELAFGVHSVHEEINEEQGVHEAMLAVGNGQTRIQLLAPLTPD
jgi:methylmalonyl-CoA/ethylmalonyl-CoA epimerase